MAVWLAVMALCLALALATWITLVFRSGRHEPEQMHDSVPHREVIGGKFDAHAGGRQVMPDPHAPLAPEEAGGHRDSRPRHAEQAREHEPPGREQAGVPQRTPARGDRP